jgi:hypothetical protein
MHVTHYGRPTVTHHVTNHLIISNDKDSNSETNEKLHVRDITPLLKGRRLCWPL